MTAGGIAFLTCSLLFVWGLTGWCYYRVLTAKVRSDEDGGGEG